MKNFQETNLIVKVGKNVYQLNSMGELIELVLGKDYIELTEKEKSSKRHESILPFSIEHKGPIRIENELIYFLSLCKLNQLQILERKDTNIFTASMDKSKMNGNYVLVNKFAEKLLKNQIKRVTIEEKTIEK